MKKGTITVVITLAIACFALTMIMSMQFKIVKETDITSIETMEEEELRTELANYKQLYKEAESQYEEKVAKLKEYQETEESIEETSELVSEELENVELYLGETDVEGEGIEITLKNNDEIEDGTITDEDLLIIVDYLKYAGAEAISINGERIINMSDIVTIGSSIIHVNQQRILSPYVIKAIGDPETLSSTLLGKGGYVQTLKDLELDVTIEKKSKIKIEKYNKEISSKYIQ